MQLNGFEDLSKLTSHLKKSFLTLTLYDYLAASAMKTWDKQRKPQSTSYRISGKEKCTWKNLWTVCRQKKIAGITFQDRMGKRLHREAVGSRDEDYILKDIVEMGDTFFGAPAEGGKRGRGTNKTPVGIQSFGGTRAVVLPTDGAAFCNTSETADYEHCPEKLDPKTRPEHLRRLRVVVSTVVVLITGFSTNC